MQEIESFYPSSQEEWRNWLIENHLSKESIWLVYFKKKSGKPSISWSQAVDEALCFGWIDSKAKPIDDEKYCQFFTKRKPKSVWSKINKQKIERFIEQNLISEAGYKSIELAKQNGSWTILDEVEELIIPNDLEIEFEKKPGSKDFFLTLSKSVKKSILQWLVMAKQESTRNKRIEEIVDSASQQLKPKPF